MLAVGAVVFARSQRLEMQDLTFTKAYVMLCLVGSLSFALSLKQVCQALPILLSLVSYDAWLCLPDAFVMLGSPCFLDQPKTTPAPKGKTSLI